MLAALPTVFAGLTHDETLEASSYLEYVEVGPGEAVMIQGEDDHTLAFIVNGHVEVWLTDVKVGTAGPRDMIGEMELFQPGPRAYSVTANTPLALHILNLENYNELCTAGNPVVFQIERAALKQLSARLRKLNEQISEGAKGSTLMLEPAVPTFMDRLTAPFKKEQPVEVDCAQVVQQSELFSWAPAEVVMSIADAFEVETYKRDEFICRQGEEADCMWIIASGEVEVALLTGGQTAETVGRLKVGHAFGDASVALQTVRTASCIARSDVVVLSMSHNKYKEMQTVDDAVGSAFRQGMIRNLILQLQATTARYVAIVTSESHSDLPEGESNIWR